MKIKHSGTDIFIFSTGTEIVSTGTVLFFEKVVPGHYLRSTAIILIS